MQTKKLSFVVILIFLLFPIFGQDLGFTMDLGLGVNSFPDPSTGSIETWQNLRLLPDIQLGKFGIGLDLSFNYRFANEDSDSGFQIRKADWVPDEELGTTVADLYFPIFRYIRYGQKGDPLFAKIGSIDDGLLGNGFIMGNYSNTMFLPRYRIIGLSLDVDALLFDIPYFGIESFIGNLAANDVFGLRMYTRPLAWSEIPILDASQFGISFVADLDPFYYEEKNYLEFESSNDPDSPEPNPYSEFANYQGDDKTVTIYGADIRVPVLNNDIVSLAVFTDLVNQNGNLGWMAGFGGRLISIVNFGAQVRILGDNFIPVYFDRTYDRYRSQKWKIYTGETPNPGYQGWFATTGITLLEGLFVFNGSVEGAFSNPDENPALSPILRAKLILAPELLAGFSVNATYEKRAIQSWNDFTSAENAIVGAAIGYKTGPATIQLMYDLRYNPILGDWDTTSKIETIISF